METNMDQATRPEGTLADVKRGWAVYSSDEQRVGDVQETGADHVIIRSGMFSGQDRTIPRAAIRRIEHDRVYLAVPKDAVASQDWAGASKGAAGAARSASDGPPAIPESIGTPGLTGVVEEGGHLVRAGSRQEAGALETSEQLGPLAAAAATAAVERPAPAASSGGVAPPIGSETQTLRLHEEQVQVGKERVQTGEVQVHKRVVTEMRTMQVPVQREEVVVEREGEVTVLGAADPAASSAGGGVAGLWQRLRARPALLVALALGTLAPLLVLGLRRSGRIGGSHTEFSLRSIRRTMAHV
jgi:hypothetical protein